MSLSFDVDRFTQAPATAEFEAFQNNIDETAVALGLHESDRSGFYPLIVGSGALAKQNINALDNKPGWTSDLDVIVSISKFRELERSGILRGVGRIDEHVLMGWTRRSQDRPLSVEVLASTDPNGYLGIGFHGEEAYKGEPCPSVTEIDGLYVLRATTVAADKLRARKRSGAPQSTCRWH